MTSPPAPSSARCATTGTSDSPSSATPSAPPRSAFPDSNAASNTTPASPAPPTNGSPNKPLDIYRSFNETGSDPPNHPYCASMADVGRVTRTRRTCCPCWASRPGPARHGTARRGTARTGLDWRRRWAIAATATATATACGHSPCPRHLVRWPHSCSAPAPRRPAFRGQPRKRVQPIAAQRRHRQLRGDRCDGTSVGDLSSGRRLRPSSRDRPAPPAPLPRGRLHREQLLRSLARHDELTRCSPNVETWACAAR
jgi:hypothetical protein